MYAGGRKDIKGGEMGEGDLIEMHLKNIKRSYVFTLWLGEGMWYEKNGNSEMDTFIRYINFLQ